MDKYNVKNDKAFKHLFNGLVGFYGMKKSTYETFALVTSKHEAAYLCQIQ